MLLKVSLTVTYCLQRWPCKPHHHGNCHLGYAESSFGLLQLQVPVLTCLQTRPLRAIAEGEITWVQSGARMCIFCKPMCDFHQHQHVIYVRPSTNGSFMQGYEPKQYANFARYRSFPCRHSSSSLCFVSRWTLSCHQGMSLSTPHSMTSVPHSQAHQCYVVNVCFCQAPLLAIATCPLPCRNT